MEGNGQRSLVRGGGMARCILLIHRQRTGLCNGFMYKNMIGCSEPSTAALL